MHLAKLKLRDFRNLAEVQLELPEGPCVFWGDNGQGKTNLLESVYLLATLKSFRGARSPALIRKGQPQARVEGRLIAAGLPRHCELTIDKRGRKLRLDGKSPRGLPEWFAHIKAVAFVPSDLRMVDGAPERRREFLDRAAFTLDPTYLDIARRFRDALKQKNALLRDARRRGRAPDPAMLEVWNERLASAGAAVVDRRTGFLRRFAPVFREVHEGITGAAKGHAEFRYRGCVPSEALSDGLSGVEAALRSKLDAATAQEANRGFAMVGPHRDDWELKVGGEALRSFGSQGQIRSAALAMRIGQMVLAKRESGRCPLFLLDDVSSELDPARNAHLMRLLGELQTQVLITTTHPSNLRMDPGSYAAWTVRDGVIKPAPNG